MIFEKTAAEYAVHRPAAEIFVLFVSLHTRVYLLKCYQAQAIIFEETSS